MADFLEAQPPGSAAYIQDFHVKVGGTWTTHQPDLQLHCDSDLCNGKRVFRSSSNPGLIQSDWQRFFLVYVCRNCGRKQKIYALLGQHTTGNQGHLHKIGEYPAFGPPVPSRVISLIGPDRDLFLQGRRCENQGLGIGAFAYYRRVVENQWHRIVEETIRVSERVGASKAVVDTLKRAATETQFSKAVEIVKSAIPEVLMISGHNPLTLLHSALSEGLHERTDEECLGLAQSVRVVLTELAERMGDALKDEVELRDALGRLLTRSQGSSEK